MVDEGIRVASVVFCDRTTTKTHIGFLYRYFDMNGVDRTVDVTGGDTEADFFFYDGVDCPVSLFGTTNAQDIIDIST
jgi:hypothetical protein